MTVDLSNSLSLSLSPLSLSLCLGALCEFTAVSCTCRIKERSAGNYLGTGGCVRAQGPAARVPCDLQYHFQRVSQRVVRPCPRARSRACDDLFYLARGPVAPALTGLRALPRECCAGMCGGALVGAARGRQRPRGRQGAECSPAGAPACRSWSRALSCECCGAQVGAGSLARRALERARAHAHTGGTAHMPVYDVFACCV